MEKIEKINLNNYKKITFEFEKISYELNTTLYSNAILIIISSSSKISQIFTLNINLDESEEENILFDEDLKENNILMSDCILGDRRNEKLKFISNIILTNIYKKIKKKSNKIKTLILSLNLPNEFYSEEIFEIDIKTKELLNIINENINKIF
jgi:hypothetical protein